MAGDCHLRCKKQKLPTNRYELRYNAWNIPGKSNEYMILNTMTIQLALHIFHVHVVTKNDLTLAI